MSKNLTKEQFIQNKTSWKKSFAEGFSQDENGSPVPWMTYPAIHFLKRNIRKDHEIFEFGCGASTLFFSQNSKKVIGVESDPKWFSLTKDLIAKTKRENVEVGLMEDALESSSYERCALNSNQKFDFIIIDSFKRYLCAINSINSLKKGGAIILDDSERKPYKKIFKFFDEIKFKRQDFVGIAPGQLRLKNTTIFWS